MNGSRVSAPFLIVVSALALTACASLPTVPGARGPAAPPPPAATAERKGAMPSSPVELGDLSAQPAAVERRFTSAMSQRYPQGAPLTAVEADLRRNGFACSPSTAVKGDPPRRICRRIVSAQGCRHTFQIHLYDEKRNGQLVRVRALHDRQCGSDGLLGGVG
jgi:hypothetical protein